MEKNRLHNAPQGTALFAYGTLCYDPVLTALLGRLPHYVPALVKGFRVVGVTGRLYPAAVPTKEAAHLSGILVLDLTAAERCVIDAFEGSEYTIHCTDATPTELPWQTVASYLYVVDSDRAQSPVWDRKLFEEHLDEYVRHCRTFDPAAVAP